MAAILFVALTMIVVLFQVALSVGMPRGVAAWGGKFPGRLPPAMRAASLLSICLLLGFALVVLIRAGLAVPAWQPFASVAIWFVIAYLVLGVIANAFTPSRWERMLWLPVTVVMLTCSILVVSS
ncbi:MAG: hypothetical protein KIT83_02845 [Bryobacterales bacterium]|nr:hypothetical protein [Bryobacterales bacterium]